MLTVGRARQRLCRRAMAAARLRHRERAVRRRRRAARDRRERANRQVAENMLRDLSEVKVGDPVVHAQHGIGRYLGLVNHGPRRRRHRIPRPGVRGRRQALRAGVAAAGHRPLQRRGAGGARPCTSWAAASGRRPSARPPSRCATPRRSCSTSTRSARRARATHSRSSPRTTKPSPTGFPFEETRDQAGRHRRGDRRTSPPASRWTGWSAATWASARPRWRCARPSSPSPTASRSPCWCRPRCWPSSTSRPSATASPTGRSRSPSCRASAPPRSRTPRWTALAEGEIDIVIGTHKLIQDKSAVQEPGPGHHRRGAPLRRAPQGTAQGAARRGRRAHADRHADPAHAGDVARGAARLLGDRHRPAEAPGHQDLRLALRPTA